MSLGSGTRRSPSAQTERLDQGIPMLTKVMQAVALVAALLAPSASAAQAPGGAITGVVRDPSGAAIPGATVKAVNEASGAAMECVSGDGGVYRFDALAPGRYRVEAALDGFETAVAQVVLQAGQSPRSTSRSTPRASASRWW